ncbi:MAG: tetratricopeptide repeat protein [Gemmatimonadota bacterium]|nr:MAG: tetratricopeptide repeat protein [Gemmatimonadota bacterium]
MPDKSLLQRLKERRLVQWAVAYLAGAWLVFQGVEVVADPWNLSTALQRTLHLLLIVGFFVTLVLAWYHGEKGRQRVSGAELLMIAALLAIAAILITIVRPEAEAPTTPYTGVAVEGTKPAIAVLPFDNFSPNPDDAYFADGMHEEIIRQLSRISGIKVISRTSVMQYREARPAARQIAGELGVGFLLEGSARKAEDQVRLTVQLIDASRDEHVWADDYDRDLTAAHLFEIQSDVAERVAAALEVELSASERERIERHPTESLTAYDLYLLGLYNWNAWTEEALDRAVDYFERAVELDPTMARAHAGLAVVYSHEWLHAWGSAVGERRAKARGEARMALALDSTVAEGHAALGYVLMLSADWEGADAAFRRAIDLSPSYAIAHAWLAELLAAQGRHREAWETIEQALALEPLSPYMNLDIGWLLYRARDYDRAAEELGRALELFPNAPQLHALLGAVYTQQGKLREGIAELEEGMRLSETGSWFRGYLGYAYGRAGREADARRILTELRDLAVLGYVDAELFALVHLGLGEFDEAVDWLYQAQEDQYGWAMWIPVDPIVDPLRSDPRYLALLDSVGLSGVIQ